MSTRKRWWQLWRRRRPTLPADYYYNYIIHDAEHGNWEGCSITYPHQHRPGSP